MKFELSSNEINTILYALTKEYNNTKKRKWKVSEKVMHMSELNSIRNKLVSQEMKESSDQ